MRNVMPPSDESIDDIHFNLKRGSVLKRRHPRPRLRSTDRLSWVWLLAPQRDDWIDSRGLTGRNVAGRKRSENRPCADSQGGCRVVRAHVEEQPGDQGTKGKDCSTSSNLR